MPPLLMTLRRGPAQGVRSARQLGNPRRLPGFQMAPRPRFSVSGVTRDSTGAVLGSCSVDLFDTATDRLVGSAVSDASTGAFNIFAGLGTGPFYAVAYKAGSPDVTGATVNTLTVTQIA